ncbi:MAG: flagellar hook-basal body protein, partial [Oscillospiraceae bacterium]
MNIGFYSAKTGLLSMQQGLDVASNNIANVQTNGYKEIRTNFSDLLYSAQKAQYEEAQTGHGVKVTKTDLMYENGQLLMTDRELDFVCPTGGFFAVSDSEGNTRYTRDGSFYLSNNGNGEWGLVTADGSAVLDYDNQKITLTANTEGVIDGSEVFEKLGVFKFTNPHGLEVVGGNKFIQTESSGEAVADEELDKISGALELSTVNIAEQMVKTIQLQRAFQLNAKMIQTSDEIEN